MKMILEKEFIEKLSLKTNLSELENDLELFLRNDFTGYHLLCDAESTAEFQTLCTSNPFFELLLDSCISIEFDINLKENINNGSVFEDYSKRTILFTTLSIKNAEELSKKYGQIIITQLNINDTWTFPYKMRKGITMKVTQSSLIKDSCRFDSWKKMTNFLHPFRNIIIFDKYLLKTHSPSELSINVIPLLSNFFDDKTLKHNVNVTIISEIKPGISLIKYIHKLEEIFSAKICFNIIRHSKALYPNNLEGLHARYILTDYISLRPDNSFTFFKKNGTVSAVTNITSVFTMSGDHKDSFIKDCHDLNLYLEKVNNEPNGDERYSDMYYPHKFNPILN